MGMESKKMELRIDTVYGEPIIISVDLEINGGRVTVEGARQVVGIYPVEVGQHYRTDQKRLEDRVIVMAQRGMAESIISAEIFSEKAQNWGVFNRPKLTAICLGGEFFKELKPRIEVSVSGNVIDENGFKQQAVGFSAIA